MKQWVRVDTDDTSSNALITTIVEAATRHLDGWSGILGLALISQTWELVLDAFPTSEIKIPLGPVISITSVKYDDVDGVEQTVDAADYLVDKSTPTGWVIPANGYSWPATLDSANSVRVRYLAGFGAAADVPAPLRVAIMMLAANWFNNREAAAVGGPATVLPMGVDALISPFRRVGV